MEDGLIFLQTSCVKLGTRRVYFIFNSYTRKIVKTINIGRLLMRSQIGWPTSFSKKLTQNLYFMLVLNRIGMKIKSNL